MSQLRMLYLAEGRTPPACPALPDGYALRPYRDGDFPGYARLRIAAGFTTPWDAVAFENYRCCLVPDGLMLTIGPDGTPVAAASAEINTKALWPHNGTLGWVAADPAHRGRGLGKATVAAAMRRLLQYGFRTLWLSTDDWREPALAIYLKLGWQPLLADDDHRERWERIFAKLALPPVPLLTATPPNGPSYTHLST